MCTLLLAGGCAKGPDIVGTWSGQETLPGDGGVVASQIDLRPDGTFHKKGATQAEYSGTYAVKDNVLTQTFTAYSVQGHIMPIPTDAPNVETDTFTLKDDTLTLTPQGGPPSVLKRQAAK